MEEELEKPMAPANPQCDLPASHGQGRPVIASVCQQAGSLQLPQHVGHRRVRYIEFPRHP